jgi:hypothetical protein
MLEHPAIVQWLAGIEPAWTLLDQHAAWALCQAPIPGESPLRLAGDLTPEEIQLSPIARNVSILLQAGAEGPGLKLTAKGNLSRAEVSRLVDRLDWPGFDKARYFEFHRIINEQDVLPLLFVRHLAETARLARRHKGYCKTTRAGRKVLEGSALPGLQAALFVAAFWGIDLSYLSNGIHGDWPQREAGVVLWSLSVAAHDWQSPERLTRLCAIPPNDLFVHDWDTATHAMTRQILEPLTWFGLLEQRDGEIGPGDYIPPRFWRKSPLFERFLSFDIVPSGSRPIAH